MKVCTSGRDLGEEMASVKPWFDTARSHPANSIMASVQARQHSTPPRGCKVLHSSWQVVRTGCSKGG